MRKAPIVIGASAAGLLVVLNFHTEPPKGPLVSAGLPHPTGAAGNSASGGSTATTSPSATSPRSGTAPPASTAPSATAPPTTSAPPTTTTRSATGEFVQYRYGDIELKVTVAGTRITQVNVVAEDSTDPRSEEINNQAIPYLRQQALQAQSANIDGVSGATFTSEAYATSLQSALDRLGFKG